LVPSRNGNRFQTLEGGPAAISSTVCGGGFSCSHARLPAQPVKFNNAWQLPSTN
jgi:hypothetical protein